MKEYTKPDLMITEFGLNEAVASSGCEYVDITNPTETTVYCIIGGQTENVFTTTSSCQISASKYKILDRDGDSNDYFIWYTYAGDTGSGGKPDANVTKQLDTLVTEAGFTTGSGWHYASITANSTGGYWNNSNPS